MNYFIILAIFLAISVHTIVSQDAGNTNVTETDTPNGDAGNGQGETGDQTPETSGNGTETQVPETGGNNGTGGGNTTSPTTNAMKVFNAISELPAKCSNRYTACYAADSDEDDIKGKDIKTEDDDDVCELIEDGEDCVTTEKETFVCTDEEYEKVRKQACSAPHSAVVSIFLVAILSVISKLISQQ